jgi:ribokinase
VNPPRIALIGHVEHVTLGRIEGPLRPGDVLHLLDTRFLAAGGGGIAFAQLCRSDAEVHFFTAVGQGESGNAVQAALRSAAPRVHVHAAQRAEEHPRVVVVLDGDGHRTIVVTGGPLQPDASDPLPWSVLASCDAAYFTGSDPQTLRMARDARSLVVTARRRPVLRDAQIAPDVVVGSINDPRENAGLDTYDPHRPGALVLTDGPRPVRIVRSAGTSWVETPPAPERIVGDYGAGDSFAAALTFFVAHGCPLEEACRRAGPYGAAVLGAMNPLDAQARLVAG